MTGAGFGGCGIALVNKNKLDDFRNNVIEYYSKKLEIIPDVYIVDIVDGVEEI